MAIIGFACRLPGGNNSPQKFWDFIERGQVAPNSVPKNRFNFEGHFDGSLKPKTMRQAGGMFLGDVDPADFDAGFFEVGGAEALAMDPNQRQMLEVVFEGLENAGIPLEKLDNQPVGCFVGSYAADYADMQSRDPEDRPPNNALGVGRAILANRLSHFLNIKGPSVTLDTACSGSLQGLDLACRYLQSRDVNAAVVATSNLYMNPEHLIDTGNIGSAHSPTALCHTFDADADGYVKAEAVSAIIVKRLEDAIRDRDPIRAVVLGTATNSNGRTPGIASPSSTAQAAAIRAAYAHAGITDLNLTTYLECHGTGTQAGDPTEVNGIASVFAATRPADNPLIIGSVKSNIGHSEPAAGISGLLKAILSIENGFIPGMPTFIKPSPKIDFVGQKVKAYRAGIPWPESAPRRASINSFGYGGSNAHAIIEQPTAAARSHHVSSYVSADEEFTLLEEDAARPSVLVLSANDAQSLKSNIQALGNHMINPRVKVSLSDLAYTLSERRTRLWHRAFITTKNTELDEKPDAWHVAKKSAVTPSFGFIFTGQGAQWPQMGKDLLQYFPWTRKILEELDDVLQSLASPPSWSLVKELTEPRTAEHLRQPEFSQPLVTALQLAIIAVLESWGIKPRSVVGHSSGEIAAAYAAGLLDRAGAITAAFYRGRAALNRKNEVPGDVGMLAVGLGAEAANEFIEKHGNGQAWIACFNSPNSVTVSGRIAALDSVREAVTAAGHFARRLQVDLAYHSELMELIGEEYEHLLDAEDQFHPTEKALGSGATLFSSVTESKRTTPTDALYWKTNMVSAVRFNGALKALLEDENAPNFLIEIGPSGALAGPVSQVLKSLPASVGGEITYTSSWARGADAGKALFDVAGRLWVAGADIDMATVNEYDGQNRVITDLPNYSWNHTTKYWHENASSKDWRFRKYVVHDLLGSKILGSSWRNPTWRHRLNVTNLPWLNDHRMGGDTIVPGAGFITMAAEAMYQKHTALLLPEEAEGLARNDLCYRFRNVRFSRALVLEEGKDVIISFTLSAVPGDKHWHEFRIYTTEDEVMSEHCSGWVRIHDFIDEPVEGEDALPLKSVQAPKLWYKCQREIGMEFGPAFQKLIEIEAVTGQRKCRTLISMEPPESKYAQSYYPIHPAALDGCLQTVVPSNASCDRTNVKHVMIPALIDDFIINKVPARLYRGRSKATSVYSGRGRLDIEKSWVANTTVYDSESGQLLMQITGLNYTKLDVAPKPDPHTFHTVAWKPDITFLTQDQLMYLTVDKDSNKLDTVIDLIAHKKPALKVLEVNLDDEDASNLWFGVNDFTARSAYAQYDFGTSNAKTLVSTETLYQEKGNVSFHSISPENPAFGLPTDVAWDLAIIKASEKVSATSVEDSVKSLKPLLAEGAYTLLVRIDQEGVITHAASESSDSFENLNRPSALGTSGTPSQSSDSLVASSISSTAWDEEAAKKSLAFAEANVTNSILEVAPTTNSPLAYLSKSKTSTEISTGSKKHLIVVRLSDTTPTTLPPSLHATLEASGWTITQQTYPFSKPTDGAVVLIIDELSKPILKSVDGKQWESIKGLISSGIPLLWVTKGAQYPVTDPDNAMVQGLFRTARQEDPSINVTTLDVQSSTSAATSWAIDKVLGLLKDGLPVETEYSERNGILSIQRIQPDTLVNDFRHAEEDGLPPVVKGFHSTEVQVQLRAERLGTLNGLMWAETEVSAPAALDDGQVEVEVYAVGVNFKDVAITMGIVPDNEYNIGFECAGIVKRIGNGVTSLKVGSRVCMLKAGSYSNRVRTSVQRCHEIPDHMSFEEAATIPSVYLCSLYAMYHLGNLKEGQSVLIHSATGGVGVACIELAQAKKAEIFVTVGTEEKRQFLEKEYGIQRDHMFSSRNTQFARGIMKATNGRGVNVVINSLIGELLDASWRIMADGGNMVEIGKRDIVDRNTLSMEPFDRNCSFRAVDFSYTKDIKDSLVASLFDELFVLINAGHLKPIHPITVFGFDDVQKALAYIRSGKHLGKVVISNGENTDVQVPIRPAIRGIQLRSDVSYLIIGGLKGACGTLAIHLAQNGARHIIVSSRSGINDEASARIVASCNFYGAEVVEAKGDVGNIESVRQLFKSATPRIAGVIQGAMVLRDKPFEMMTLDDWHTAIHAKVHGTWNIHRASLEQKQQLDMFTMLSSTSGVVGNKGQANYAAANTFLDAFASYRQTLGLHANTVDLGVIEDVGYIAEQDTGLEARFDKRVWTPIGESMLRKILTYSSLQQESDPLNPSSVTEMITGIGYPLPADSDGLARDGRFGYLFNSRGGSNSGGLDVDESDQTEQAIKQFRLMHKSGASVADLKLTCLEVVSAQFAKTLRLEAEPEKGRPLVAYGLDSLSAVELRNWIRMRLGVELTTLDITNAASLIALSEKVVSKLPQPEAAA
ncbi:uncharacterized protein F4807DRAFT_471537 [Annulohypoxylon truncatum]|uniref:uncharacterized protein n=1 Tax=Annulohypoxylon truncatum TaxID=327061 RepID=UPI0020088A5E|nr:uncharacterized protein F4807DRAFT_471537 [Annulohypoxylon truncatum]KAI1213019.1 hypothetical protein F4807DRAFT_471537 [Annulohypoxylon truncatum]